MIPSPGTDSWSRRIWGATHVNVSFLSPLPLSLKAMKTCPLVRIKKANKHESHSRKHLAHHCWLPLHPLPSPLQVLWWEVPVITNRLGEEEGSQTKDHFLPFSVDQPAGLCHLPDFAVSRGGCEGGRSCEVRSPPSSQACSLLQGLPE